MYRRARRKAVLPDYQREKMSVIIDASGGLGASYAPHFAVSGKGEPERHELLKIKSTFAKIHGIGTTIFMTNSQLDGEGSNLALECLYHCVIMFLEKRQVSHIRDLYVQLDNTNSNKSKAFLAGCAVLVTLGIVRKVKVIL